MKPLTKGITKKKEPFKTFKTEEDWDKVYWEVFREGRRSGKRDLLDKMINAFPWGSPLRGIFEVMKGLI